MKISELEYKRANVDELYNCIKLTTEKINNAKTVNDVIVARNNYIEKLVYTKTMQNLAYIRWSINTVDEFYNAEKEYYDCNLPKLLGVEVEYIKSILNSKFRKELEKIIPETMFGVWECQLKSQDASLENLKIEENSIVNEYSNMMSSLTAEYNGEIIPVTLLKKYFDDPNRDIRKETFDKYGEVLQSNTKELDTIFDKLVKNRTEQAKVMGYDSYTNLGYLNMSRLGYGMKDIQKFRENIVKYIIPVVTKMRRELGKNMGIDDLKLYDYSIIFKSGIKMPNITDDELVLKGKEIYNNISKDTSEFFNWMLDGDAIDYKSKKNKWGGGYEDEISWYKKAFILANFNGSVDDVDTLTHECGHAYHSYCSFRNNKDQELGLPFMEIAESHSMSMEFFCEKYIKCIFEEETAKYSLKHLVDSLSFLGYGSMVDHFQEYVYNNPNLSPKERKDYWLELEGKYRPYINMRGMKYLEEGTRWQYQMHIYESPFYYIDYVLAQFVSLQFYFLSLEDYELAFKKYQNFVNDSCDYPFLKLLEKNGLKSPLDEEFMKDFAIKSEELYNSIKEKIHE